MQKKLQARNCLEDFWNSCAYLLHHMHGVTLIQLLGEVLCISFSFIAEVTLVIEG